MVATVDAAPQGYTAFQARRGDNALYRARLALKRLGGYWDPRHRRWLVPTARVAEAEAAIALARKIGRDLEEVDLRSDTVLMVCYECGRSYAVSEVIRRGGCAREWYCGCEEPQNKPDVRPFRLG